MPTDPVILITGIYPSKKKKKITHVQKKTSWMCKEADCSIVHNGEKIETT